MDDNNIFETEAFATDADSDAQRQECKFCPACGRRLALDAAFCDGCGIAQKKSADDFEPQPIPVKNYAPEKISDIIGKERQYYNNAFSAMQNSGSNVRWNWYACLGWYWYAYRKMPIEAVAFFAIFFAAGFLPFGRLMQLALLALNGAFGNYIYLKHIRRTIDRIDAMPPAMRCAAVRDYGGVSGLMLVIAFILSGLFFGGLGILRVIFRRILPKSTRYLYRFVY